MSRKTSGTRGAPDLTPAQADAELVRRAGELDDAEIERLAAIADQGDEETAAEQIPDFEEWTQQQRDELIAGWRTGRRWLARSAMRPAESGDDWRERLIAQSVAEQGCAPLIIPASRAEDVIERDLAALPRRRRKQLFKPGGHRSGKDARQHVLRVLRRADMVPVLRPRVDARPRERRNGRRAAQRGCTRAGPDDGDPEPTGPPPRASRCNTGGAA